MSEPQIHKVRVIWTDSLETTFEVIGWRIDFAGQIELIGEDEVAILNPSQVAAVQVPNLGPTDEESE